MEMFDFRSCTPSTFLPLSQQKIVATSFQSIATPCSSYIKFKTILCSLCLNNESSESLEANSSTKQRDDESAASKTSLSSSTATTGSQRRSRIKPTVASVARSRPNAATKNKTSADAGKNELDGKSKEEITPVSQSQLGDKEDPLSRRLIFDGEDADGTSTPSSQEGNQAVTSTRNPAEISASLTNIEQRTQPGVQETVVKPSQIQNRNTNSDTAVLQPSDGGTTPSLLRRKRVLPNLGSAARRRRSSVSKENVEKNPDFHEVRQEEINSAHRDEGLISVSEEIVDIFLFQ